MVVSKPRPFSHMPCSAAICDLAPHVNWHVLDAPRQGVHLLCTEEVLCKCGLANFPGSIGPPFPS